jgi:hypothetical protein
MTKDPSPKIVPNPPPNPPTRRELIVPNPTTRPDTDTERPRPTEPPSTPPLKEK